MDSLSSWYVLWRRKKSFVGSLLTVTLMASVGAYVLPVSYVATATLRHTTSSLDLSLLTGSVVPARSGTAGEMENSQSRMALITVRPLLARVATALQLRDRRGELELPRVGAGFVQQRLRPTPRIRLLAIPETSDLFQIESGSADPDEAAMLANTLAEMFIQTTYDRALADFSHARTTVEQQIAVVRSTYLESAAALRDYRRTTNTVNLEREIATSIERQTTLLQEKHTAINQLAELEARMAILREQLSVETPDNVSNVALEENIRILELKRSVDELESLLAAELIEKTEEHPDVLSLKVRLATAKHQLASEIATFQDAPASLKALEQDAAAQQARLALVDQELNRLGTSMAALPQKLYGETPLLLKLTVDQSHYNALLSSLHQIGIAEAALTSDISLVEPAEVPTLPKSKRSIYAMAVFLGVLSSVGLVFLSESLSPSSS